MYRFFTFLVSPPAVRSRGSFTTVLCRQYTGHNVTSAPGVTAARPKGIRVDREEGISKGLGGFGHYAGSITAFMKSDAEKKAGINKDEPLPCSVAGSQASLQAMQAKLVEEAATTGKLPSPRLKFANTPGGSMPKQPVGGTLTPPKGSSLPRRAAAQEVKRPVSPGPSAAAEKKSATAAKQASTAAAARETDAEEYYRSISPNQLSKEELWQRVKQASAEKTRKAGTEEVPFVINAEEVDYFRMEEDLRQMDPLHYSMGELAYPDEAIRRNYYAMWYLVMSLNKARWAALEVQSQRGVKSTGAGMKLMFWKEAINSIIEKKEIISSQFTDSHPVLRPFGSTVSSTPHMTKAFVRGFTSARLQVIQQPGNVKQLFDHFDKFYGYFLYSLLEVTQVKDENAEHMLQHVGRAIGLVTHSVMLWKKYVRLGVTMLPADLCADNHVNLALLKNIPLASRDGGVRKLLYDVMCIAKTEMLSAQKLAPLVPPKVWPVVMECLYPNYYLGFLQRHNFNVSAMFADYNIENPGLVWYRLKKRWEWEKHQSIDRLLDEAAPLPLIRTSLFHSASKYKMANKSGYDRK